MNKKNIVSGILKTENAIPYIETIKGSRLFYGNIWKGYILHWENKRVKARELKENDYSRNKPIVILWPKEEENEEKKNKAPFFEIYYNERLLKYKASLLGHIAINVNNTIYNFSNKLNENEKLTPEEYFYRPALGEFSPHPVYDRYNIDNPEKVYYDKFGRLFMRTIHVLRVSGPDIQAIDNYLSSVIKTIDSVKAISTGDIYSGFRLFSHNCATIIRDALKINVSSDIKGVFPLDLFINAIYEIKKLSKNNGWDVKIYSKKQLKVEEAEFSNPGLALNPLNMIKKKILKLNLK